MEEKSTAFRRLLLKAIGGKTQAEFAEAAGITQAHLNKMLNGRYEHTPTIRTLHKIESASDGTVTMEELAKATGIALPLTASEQMPLDKVAKLFNTRLQEMAKLAKGKLSTDNNLKNILLPYTNVLANLPVRGCQVIAGDAHPYNGVLCPNCEHYSVATAMARDGACLIQTYMVLYLISTAKNGYFIVDIAFDGASLQEIDALPHEIEVEVDSGDMTPEQVDESEFITVITNKNQDSSDRSGEKRALLRAMVGLYEPNDVHRMYPTTIEGFGFFTEDISADALHEFLKNHDQTIDHIDLENIEDDWELLAAILSYETDYRWGYLEPDENDKYQYNRPCIVIDTDTFDRYTDIMIDTIAQIARELSIERFGTIMFTYDTYNYSSFRQYEVVGDKAVRIEDFVQEHVWTLSPEQPAKSGIYKARDKFGRIQGAIYDGNQWTDLAGASLHRPVAWICVGTF